MQTLHTTVFHKDKFTEAQAFDWLKQHGLKTRKKHADNKANTWRIRIVPPWRFVPGSFYSKEIKPGLVFVWGTLKD